MATLKLIFGAGMFTKVHGFNSADDVKPWLDALLENKAKGLVTEVDTAAAYQQSEGFLGQLKFGSHFAIGTKLFGGSRPDQPSTKENVIAQAKESLAKLHVNQVTSNYASLILSLLKPRYKYQQCQDRQYLATKLLLH